MILLLLQKYNGKSNIPISHEIRLLHLTWLDAISFVKVKFYRLRDNTNTNYEGKGDFEWKFRELDWRNELIFSKLKFESFKSI